MCCSTGGNYGDPAVGRSFRPLMTLQKLTRTTTSCSLLTARTQVRAMTCQISRPSSSKIVSTTPTTITAMLTAAGRNWALMATSRSTCSSTAMAWSVKLVAPLPARTGKLLSRSAAEQLKSECGFRAAAYTNWFKLPPRFAGASFCLEPAVSRPQLQRITTQTSIQFDVRSLRHRGRMLGRDPTCSLILTDKNFRGLKWINSTTLSRAIMV